MNKQPLITLTTDFGYQTQGIGIMHAVAFEINPKAKVIDLAHGLPDFSITSAARTLETLHNVPVGCHICIVDPGVGTKRLGIIIKVKRGDYLIGPDNGVLIPATKFLGGIKKVVAITNEKYMRLPVSPVFHGRDIFMPAAAHLSLGVPMEKFGPKVKPQGLKPAPYEEAEVKNGKIEAQIIHINKYGSVHLNILAATWDQLGLQKGETIRIAFNQQRAERIPFFSTFGDVPIGQEVIFKDDYGRIEIAINQGDLALKYRLRLNNQCQIYKSWNKLWSEMKLDLVKTYCSHDS